MLSKCSVIWSMLLKCIRKCMLNVISKSIFRVDSENCWERNLTIVIGSKDKRNKLHILKSAEYSTIFIILLILYL